MQTRRLFALLALAAIGLLLIFLLAPDEREQPEPSPVVLVSLDGFRWDYADRYDAPVLRRLAAEGVRARSLIPAFPTKTFPNHYTIVTGLYPEHHGIVSNTMYDPQTDARFSLGNREAVQDGRWWGGEPIWVTAEQQGLRTAAFFWPGSEAEIKGTRPTYWMPFDDDFPAEARVDTVLAWLDLPAERRPAFVTLYFSDVDHAGHDAGPDADETAAAVRRVDAYLGRLVEGLQQRGRYDEVNLIVVSDHGMADTDAGRVVVLDDYVDLEDVVVVDRSPVVMLYAKEGREAAVYEALQRAPHLSVYRREEVPERLHFRAHHRIPPIIGIADEGWSIATRAYLERRPEAFAGGAHGYDNALSSMGGLFVAHGPAFEKGVEAGPFQNIHLYNLMTSILGLRPAPNDGDLDSVRTILRAGAARP